MQDDAERVRGFIHYKRRGADTAACGFSGGIISHQSWDKVSCPDCLKKRRRLAKEPLLILVLVILGVAGGIILMVKANPF